MIGPWASSSMNNAVNAGEPLDAISVEIDAMHTIAGVLAGIRDPDMRQRVLQWANQRFGTTPETGATSIRTASVAPNDDPSLSVDTLHDLFDGPGTCGLAASHPVGSVSGVVQDETPPHSEPMFTEAEITAIDLADLAAPQHRQTTAADEALALQAIAEDSAPPAAVTAAAVEGSAAPAPTREAREDQGLDALVKGFASALQRLAVDWSAG